MRKYVRTGGANLLGILLIICGIIILIVSLPCWLWNSVLGLILIAAGFVLWRFG